MASKSKRRRRVLGASCILAALIVAGSSFAWFTSKDEVTNRLSANADYGVSIVESFAPPKNWLPGEEVDKDVYATNTGNIGAFVEEDVSGALTVTVEQKVDEFSNDCVELTQAERYAMEAGSFLALKPEESAKVVGDQVVAFTPDSTNPNAYTEGTTNFTPDKEGLYVFRRSIDVDQTSKAETFEYAGYYFKDGKYYKVELASVTPDSTADFANDGVVTDGNLTAATPVYFKEKTEVLDPVTLEYDANGNKLVATYDTGNSTTNNLVTLAKAYDDAIAAYERAAEAVTRAANDLGDGTSGTSATLTAKKTALDAAATALQNALNEQKAAKVNLDNATAAFNQATAAKTAAQSAVDASKTKLYGSSNGTETSYTGGLKKAYVDATNARVSANGRDQFEADFSAWATSNPNAKGTSALDDYTYEEFMTFVPVADNQVYYEKVAEEKRAKEAYEAELTKLHGSTDTAAEATPTSLEGKLAAATTALGDAESGATKAMNDAQTRKTNADNALYGEGGTAENPVEGSAQANYNKALSEYNAALTESNNDTTNLKAAQANLAAATAAKAAAEKAYNDANSATPSDGILKININLSSDVVTAGGTAGKWQLVPDPIVDNVAKFYYTSILGAGQTSAKLIDSVELDSSATQDMYKSFDFDLNVALKSAQMAYDTDNTTIKADAATATLGKTPTLIAPTDINTALAW